MLPFCITHGLYGRSEKTNQWNSCLNMDIFRNSEWKGPADRLAAAIKKNVNAYVNEGNQVTNADEFIAAAASHRGVKAASLYTGTIDTPNDGGDSDEGVEGSMMGTS